MKVGQEVYNTTKKLKEKAARIFKIHANKKERVPDIRAGDIVGVAGLRDSTTGDSLCDESHPILLESIEFYKPVVFIAVEPKSTADQDKLSFSLSKLAEEPHGKNHH